MDPLLFTMRSSTNILTYSYYDVDQVPEINGIVTCKTYKEKMYGLADATCSSAPLATRRLERSDPRCGWQRRANGSGYIDIGSQRRRQLQLERMEVYYDKMAIFSKLSCQLWFLDPDPA